MSKRTQCINTNLTLLRAACNNVIIPLNFKALEVGILVQKLIYQCALLITRINQIDHEVNGICSQFKIDP